MATDRRMVEARLASTHIVLGFVEDSVLGVTYMRGGVEYVACGSSVRGHDRVLLLRLFHEGTEHFYPFPVRRTELQIEPV